MHAMACLTDTVYGPSPIHRDNFEIQAPDLVILYASFHRIKITTLGKTTTGTALPIGAYKIPASLQVLRLQYKPTMIALEFNRLMTSLNRW